MATILISSAYLNNIFTVTVNNCISTNVIIFYKDHRHGPPLIFRLFMNEVPKVATVCRLSPFRLVNTGYVKMATSWYTSRVNGKKSSGTTVQDDSSESEVEEEHAKVFHRRISTNKEIKTSVSTTISQLTTVCL